MTRRTERKRSVGVKGKDFCKEGRKEGKKRKRFVFEIRLEKGEGRRGRNVSV